MSLREGAPRTRGAPSSKLADGSAGGPGRGARSFAAITPGAGAGATKAASRDYVLPLLLLALVVVAVVQNLVLRVTVPLALATAAVALLVRGSRRRSADAGASRGICVDGHGLFFQPESGPPENVVPLAEPFGMTLVTSAKRDRMVAVWSSPEGLFYVGSTFEGPARRALGALFDRAFTAVGDDAALEALGPDGAPLELLPSDFAALVFAVEELDPACVERLVLSDARGAPLTLDGRELVVGERRFDLTAPLEWRPFVFQEAFGQAVAVYQGTSIRQGGSEAVLVALLPSILPYEFGEEGELDRSLLRDLRLMQAPPEDPPPRDARVAIDRLFVLPVRSALDKAPRASQQPSRARA
ncbi:IMP dehydrogenase [Polyangium spumosum]|uniref:IMP dehydrogenase n=1 Tax=Polyangium spumosum TaxID=889282 RepID=A0A6N7PIE1_9BACT|nr:IMP dehydrogenase [Polyangium spumosum]MRG91748.1 IMP dehydrogenase [Polyangium spumosum]